MKSKGLGDDIKKITSATRRSIVRTNCKVIRKK